MMVYAKLPEFKIEDYLDRLTPVEGKKDRWHCPCCHNKNFTFKLEKGWNCWNGCTPKAVMEAVRPIKEAIAEAKQDGKTVPRSSGKVVQLPTKAAPKPAPLPSDGICLAQFTTLPTDAPQPQKRPDRRHGEVTVTRYSYSETQWIERVQWADPEKAKGYDKDYYPFCIAKGGEQVPIRKGKKITGHREAEPGETLCGKGTEAWQAYRIDEAIALALEAGANAILFPEGENCVETYRAHGWAALTLSGSGWSKADIAGVVERVKSAELAIVMHPDHDEAGYAKAQKIAEACAAAGVPYLQIDPTEIDPDLEEHGDVANLIAKLGDDDYQQKLQAEIKRQWELRQQLEGGGSDRPPGGGNGGDGGDDGNSGLPENQWFAPESWQSEIGYWVVDKVTEERFFKPCCNFDFQVVRELISEDGGGIEISIQRSVDRVERQIFIESIAYTSPDKFVDAVKRALGSGIVCTLGKADLSALIHTRLRDYHQRGGKSYRLAERRGRQDDGVWVFENCQFNPDGTPTDTEQSGWVYSEIFPNCEDIIPSPSIAPYNAGVLRQYLETKQKAFGENFYPSLLMDGWVVAGIFDADIMARERAFPLVNCYGDPGGFKTHAAECSLSLVGYSNGQTVLSKISESALFEWMKRLGSIPVILDDPKREFNGIDIEEVVKRAYNRFARVVRGNRQEPHSSLAITSNHLIGEKNSAARSRLIPLFFLVLADSQYDKAAFDQLQSIRESVSGCFPDLLKLGYNPAPIKALEAEFHQHLPVAHARTAKSLAIVTHYASELVRMAGLDEAINIKDWVIKYLCPTCNESQAGLSSVADFAEHLDVLVSQSLVGEWCLSKVVSEDKAYMAMHLPTVWKEFDREFSPSYNRSVLERVLLERGALKNKVAKFWADRDQSLAYKRQRMIVGDGDNKPKEPQRIARKCLLIPIEVWENLFGSSPPPPPPAPPSGNDDGGSPPPPPSNINGAGGDPLDPELPPPALVQLPPVTSSYLPQVTRSNPSAAMHTTMLSDCSYLVISDLEEKYLEDCEATEADGDSGSIVDSTVRSQVTEVTDVENVPETSAMPSVQPVTSSELPEVTAPPKQVTGLSSEVIAQAVQMLQEMTTLEGFKAFFERYQRCTRQQQDQVMAAAGDSLTARFYQFLEQFEQSNPEAIQVESVRQQLELCLGVADYQQVLKQYGQSIVTAAIELLSVSSKKTIERLAAFKPRH